MTDILTLEHGAVVATPSPPSTQLAAPAPWTIDEIIVAWLDAKEDRSKSQRTRRAYDDTITGFRQALLATGRDLDAHPRDLALAAQGWAGRDDPSPATFNQRIAILSSFYQYAGKRDLLAIGNPMSMVDRRPVQSYGSAQALEAENVREQLAAIDRTTLAGLRDYALLAVGLHTGRRVSELASLRWSSLQIVGGKVTLTFERAKGGKIMRDRLSPRVAQALMTWLQAYYGGALSDLAGDSPLWVSLALNGTKGSPLTPQAIGAICLARLKTSKVHTLRHTFARAMEDAGAKVSDIQSRLGHSSLQTTGRYLAALRSAENPHAMTLEQFFLVDEDGS